MVVVERLKPANVHTVAGDVREVRGKLGRIGQGQVIAVVLPNMTSRQRDVAEAAIKTVATYATRRVVEKERARLDALVEALATPVPAAEATFREARMIATARAEVLGASEWLTAAEIAELAGFSKTNPNTQPSQWKRSGRIFAILPKDGVERFPAYGLAPNEGYRPIKVMADVLRVFKGRKEGWGLAYWFVSGNGTLRGRRPQDVLSSDPERVIAAARADAQDILHG